MMQYRNIKPYVDSSGLSGQPQWISDEEKERLTAYDKYEEIYWNLSEGFKLMRRGTEIFPIIVPQPMVVADETSHFYLKDLRLDCKEATHKTLLDPWLKAIHFTSKLLINKHSGVVRGDWVFHMVADPAEPEGHRVQLISVDPRRYFPVYDDDDLDLRTKVHLAESFMDTDKKSRIRRLTYSREKVGGVWRIVTQEGVYESDERAWARDEPPLNRWITPPAVLPASITEIPVFHFKNKDWQGDVYGSSELRGFERVMAALDQGISDNELALALEGLGVYVTDAGSPIDSNGKPTNWEISPGRVLEVPSGSLFHRVKGIEDVAPIMEHLNYLEKHMYEGSGTSRFAVVPGDIAQSGIAMTVHFLPTAAKLEQRDRAGLDMVYDIFEQWKIWTEEYEHETVDDEITPALGEKLPVNRVEFLTELNNMLDREVISRAEYRRQLTERLGYVFPSDEDLMTEIGEELEDLSTFKLSGQLAEPQGGEGQVDEAGNPVQPISPSTGQPMQGVNPGKPSQSGSTLPKKNSSNNHGRSNESRGTEPTQTTRRQQGVRPR